MKHKFRIDFIALVVLLSFFAGCDGTFSLTKPIQTPRFQLRQTRNIAAKLRTLRPQIQTQAITIHRV